MVSKQKSLGQYFTPDNIVRFMVDLISHDNYASVLEPSAGTGNFLKILDEKKFQNVDAYEIDDTLENNSKIPIKYKDFLSDNKSKKYDVIIGNPPYTRWKNIPKNTQDELLQNQDLRYRLNGLMDILHAFLLKSLDSLKDNGELIFITPTFWTETLHTSGIRKQMMIEGSLESVILLDETKIFDNVSSNIMIFKFIKTKKTIPIKVVHVPKTKKITNEILLSVKKTQNNLKKGVIENIITGFTQNQFSTSDSWKFMPEQIRIKIEKISKSCKQVIPQVKINIKGHDEEIPITDLLIKEDLDHLRIDKEKCDKIKISNTKYYLIRELNEKDKSKIDRTIRLGDIAEIGNGMVSGLDKAFKINKNMEFSSLEQKKFIKVAKAYSLNKFTLKEFTPYVFVNDINSEKDLKKFENIYEQLVQYKEELLKRYNYDKEINWWEWVFLRNKKLLETHNEKIFVPCKERINKKEFVRFAFTSEKCYATQDVTTIVKKPQVKEDLRYILAILNSKITFFWIKHMGLSRGGVVEFSERPLSKIPIRLINWNNPEEVEIHDKIVMMVSDILKYKNIEVNMKEIEGLIQILYGLKM